MTCPMNVGNGSQRAQLILEGKAACGRGSTSVLRGEVLAVRVQQRVLDDLDDLRAGGDVDAIDELADLVARANVQGRGATWPLRHEVLQAGGRVVGLAGGMVGDVVGHGRLLVI